MAVARPAVRPERADPGGRREEQAELRRLEVTSFVEGITLVLLLCVAVPLKHLGGYASAVHVMGPVHGLAVLSFLWTAIQAVAGGGWSVADAARLFVGALVPFGGFLNIAFLRRRAVQLG